MSYVITMKCMLFEYSDYYASGGWNDFEGFFDTIEEAKEHLFKSDSKIDRSAHIVGNAEKIVWRGTYENGRWKSY